MSIQGSRIHLRQLSKQFQQTPVLQQIDLDIQAGEFIAIVGRSGCGKSTLVNSISGHPDCEVISGNVLFNDINLLDKEVHERALEGVYLSPQYPPVIEGLSHASFLKESLNAKNKYLNKDEVDSYEFLKLLKNKNIIPYYLNGFFIELLLNNNNFSKSISMKLKVNKDFNIQKFNFDFTKYKNIKNLKLNLFN